MKNTLELKLTTNRSVHNRLYKLYISNKFRICGRCPYHRRENYYRAKHSRRSWKSYRKNRWR